MVEKVNKPDWFNVKKYDETYNFHAYQWYQELTLRYWLIYSLENGVKLNSTDLDSIEYLRSQSFQLKLPFALVHSKGKRWHYQGDLYNFWSEKGIVKKGLWSPSLREYVEKNKVIEKSKKEEFYNYDSPVDMVMGLSIFKDEDISLRDFIETKSLTVNILEDEGYLLQQFKEWLSDVKQVFSIDTKSKLSSQFVNWSQQRLLGWMDIYIWMLENGLKYGQGESLTKKIIDSWLYSDIKHTSSYSDTFLRNAISNAKKIKEPNFLKRLYLESMKQYDMELNESNK